MATEKAGAPRGFRPRPKTAERLDYAEKLGLNCSELINKILDDNLRDYIAKELKARQNEIREALAAPLP